MKATSEYLNRPLRTMSDITDETLSSARFAGDTTLTSAQVQDHMLRHGYTGADFVDFQNAVESWNDNHGNLALTDEYYVADVIDWLGY